MKLGVGPDNGLILPDELTIRYRGGKEEHLCLVSAGGTNYGRVAVIYRTGGGESSPSGLAARTVDLPENGWIYGCQGMTLKWVVRS